MKVSITSRDIFIGIPGDASLCPIALAIKSALNTPEVFVSLGDEVATAFIGSGPESREIELPTPCFIWAKQFDRRQPVQPFDLELEAAR